MSEPREFHFRDAVQREGTEEIGVVLFAKKDGDAWWVYYDVDDDYVADAHSSHLVHASDGAPLGEWEPLREEVFRNEDDLPGEAVVAKVVVDLANRIIRGEAPQ